MSTRVLWQQHYDEREELMKNLKILITVILEQIGPNCPEMSIIQETFQCVYDLAGNTFAV